MSVPVVYDTMVFFQAAARPDRTHATFRAIREGRVTLCLSPDLLAEIQDVLNRDSVRARFPGLTDEGVKIFIADVLASSMLFDAVPRVFTWPRHPDDDHLFNLAIHAKARYLVTWETRLLKFSTDTIPDAQVFHQLAPGLAIVTPKMLAVTLKASASERSTPPAETSTE